jgi:hypothetical protein
MKGPKVMSKAEIERILKKINKNFAAPAADKDSEKYVNTSAAVSVKELSAAKEVRLDPMANFPKVPLEKLHESNGSDKYVHTRLSGGRMPLLAPPEPSQPVSIAQSYRSMTSQKIPTIVKGEKVASVTSAKPGVEYPPQADPSE